MPVRQRDRASYMQAYHQKHRQKGGYIMPRETEADLRPYKEPLTPVENGYGYYGTIAQSKDKEWLQCHECGFFFKSVGKHAYSIHGLSAEQYREKYQLSRTTSLVPEATRIRHGLMQFKTNPALRQQRLENLRKAQKNRNPDNYPTKSLERKNKEGRCYYQLLDKITKVGNDLHKTPSKRDFIAVYGEGYWMSCIETFGSWNQAVSLAGYTPSNVGGAHRVIYDRDMVIAALRTFYEVEGRVPRARDMGTLIPSKSVIRRLFGGIIEARRAAGFGMADYVNEDGTEYQEE